MITDPFSNYTDNALKSTIAIERILRDMRCNTSLKIGDSPNMDMTTKKETISYGGGRYTYVRQTDTMNITVKDDWYTNVFLNGVSAVTYKQTYMLCLDAAPADQSLLKQEFQDMDFRVFKAKLPVRTVVPTQRKTSWGVYTTHRSVWNTEERFMVATALAQGGDSKCYAALHPNAAASNLKRWLLAEMSKAMNI